MIKVQFWSADGLKMNGTVPCLRDRHQRMCMRILRLNGDDCFDASTMPPMVSRTYVLWSRLKDGRYVYREDL